MNYKKKNRHLFCLNYLKCQKIIKVHRSKSRCAASWSRKRWMATWGAVTTETAATASPPSSSAVSSSNPSRPLPCQPVSSVSSTEVSNNRSSRHHSGLRPLNPTVSWICQCFEYKIWLIKTLLSSLMIDGDNKQWFYKI